MKIILGEGWRPTYFYTFWPEFCQFLKIFQHFTSLSRLWSHIFRCIARKLKYLFGISNNHTSNFLDTKYNRNLKHSKIRADFPCYRTCSFRESRSDSRIICKGPTLLIQPWTDKVRQSLLIFTFVLNVRQPSWHKYCAYCSL